MSKRRSRWVVDWTRGIGDLAGHSRRRSLRFGISLHYLVWSVGARVALGSPLFVLLSYAGQVRAQLGAPTGAGAIRVERAPSARACADAEELTRAVENLVHHPLSNGLGTPQNIEISVAFARSPAGYSATIRVAGAKAGERSISDGSPTCTPLVQAVSVTIALLLDARREEPATDSNPPLANPVVPGTAAAFQRKPQELPLRLRPALQLSAFAELGAIWGGVSGGTAVMLAGLESRWGSLLATASLGHLLPRTVRAGSGEVATSLGFTRLEACYLWGEAMALGPCGLLAVGQLGGHGSGYINAGSERFLWSAAGGGLVFRGIASRRLFFAGKALLWLPFRSQSFSIEGFGVAYESARAALSATVSAGVRFW